MEHEVGAAAGQLAGSRQLQQVAFDKSNTRVVTQVVRWWRAVRERDPRDAPRGRAGQGQLASCEQFAGQAHTQETTAARDKNVHVTILRLGLPAWTAAVRCPGKS